MAARLVKVYTAGTQRAIWTSDNEKLLRAQGALPQRASRVEVIPDGEHRGLFHVDFSPLAAITGDCRYAVCLPKPFASYHEAVAAEVAWLQQNWMLSHG
jgi:hypothetical protein